MRQRTRTHGHGSFSFGPSVIKPCKIPYGECGWLEFFELAVSSSRMQASLQFEEERMKRVMLGASVYPPEF